MTSISGISSIAPQWNRPNVEGLASKASKPENTTLVETGSTKNTPSVSVAVESAALRALINEVSIDDNGVNNRHDRHGHNSHS